MQVDGKVWVVTGAGSGMGRELTLEILDRGGHVAAADVRAESLEETSKIAGVGDRLSTHVVDITDRDATQSLATEVQVTHGAVDGLINNAGIIQPFEPVNELDFDAIERVIRVNLMGCIYMTKAFLPALLDRPEAHIANVSSMGGFFPFPGQTVYGASKAGVKLFTEGLYTELVDTNVNVSLIFPGAVNTNIATNSGVEMAGMDAASSGIPMTTPDDAARMMLNGIEHNRYHIYVGWDSLLMGVAIRIAPRLAVRVVSQLMAKMMPAPAEAPDSAEAR